MEFIPDWLENIVWKSIRTTLPIRQICLAITGRIFFRVERINDSMGKYAAENCVKNLIAADKPVKSAKVAILGFTFKENCPDTRDSKVWDIVNELKEYGIDPIISAPVADVLEAKRIYGIDFAEMDDVKDMDAIILAVAHDEF